MNQENNFQPRAVRSPLLMNRDDTAVIIVDMQEKLLPHIHRGQGVLENAVRVVTGAGILGIPVLVTEQYPKGLGTTVAPVRNVLPQGSSFEKTMFSCRECGGLSDALQQKNVLNVMLAGVESHVCVMQTALDLMTMGYNVFVCTDATGSRFKNDFKAAIQRMDSSGTTLVTTEMALFEWCRDASEPEFKEISRLVKDRH